MGSVRRWNWWISTGPVRGAEGASALLAMTNPPTILRQCTAVTVTMAPLFGCLRPMAQADSFSARDLSEHLELEPIEASYSDGILFRGQILRANSLARLNLLPEMGTPVADGLLARFRSEWGYPAHAILLFDLARCIELIYCLERAVELLETDLSHAELRAPCGGMEGEGYGLVEAPRGPLIHHYVISGGLVERARFVIPTQYNILAIERALEVAARRYITDAGISLGWSALWGASSVPLIPVSPARAERLMQHVPRYLYVPRFAWRSLLPSCAR